ncbi:MAG: PD-(D/E)XK nuclease family protein [Flavobacteriaceae bacterium]|nr:PD-(D/E)XK nuclease family protein [Flavobacteriaceae bacterium]
MKNSFLHNIAIYIEENNLLSSDVKIILPSKRAGLFLKKELTSLINYSAFLPQILSIEEFTQQLTDIGLLDGIHLQFELYQVYKEIVSSSEQDSFEKFIKWAPRVLQDFNDIDSYLVDANKIFANLSDLKRLEQWTPNSEPSVLSLNYIDFFKILNKLYFSLCDRLIEKQQAYQGLINREAVKNISVYCSNLKGKIIFAGFNALNKAEEIIIQELLSQQKAKMFWDVDKTLLDEKHPSTKFITHYKNTWPYYKNNPFNWITSSFKTPKNIHFIGAVKQVAQVKMAGQILENISKTDVNFSETALVLGQENVLNVALESLPNSIDKVNITMGYALQNMPLASLFSGLFKANINALKFNRASGFYHKDFENIFLHPYMSKIIDEKSFISNKIIKKIHTNNLSFVNFKSLTADVKSPLKYDFVFKPTGNDVPKFLKNCIELINLIKENNDLTDLEREFLYRFYNLFLELEALENNYHFIADLKTLYHFYLSLLRNEKLFFKGEPLNGLQIMGLLETRALDFENLIITSVNEGILPSGKSSNSFLPYAIKNTFGLPTYQDKDSIFSYHFFRLIQRAKNVYLIYNTEVDDFGASEKSRFLTQLELMLPEAIIKETVTSNLESKLISPRKIKINSAIKVRLKEIAEKGISPSAVDVFIKNPLNFYYSKILKIKETSNLEETIADNTFGTVIHETLFHLYTPYINQNLSVENLKNITKSITKALNKNAAHYYKNGSIESGKNKLYFEMAHSYIKKLVQHELNLLKQGKSIKLLALEIPLETVLNVPDVAYPIKIKGIADRIDCVNGKLRILDYKTGVVDVAKLRVTNFDTFFYNENNTKALQLFMYAFMYAKSNHITADFEAGIISFKRLNNYILKINFKTTNLKQDFNITEERLDLFESSLKGLLKSIFKADEFTEKPQKNDHY